MNLLPQPWTSAMEAAVFMGWNDDHLLPHAARRKATPSADAASHCGRAALRRSRVNAGQSHWNCRDAQF